MSQWITIALSGHMRSDLDWRFAHDLAQNAIKERKKIFWQIDLGLFNPQGLSIDNETLFQSLCLALEHFRDGLWNQFQESSIGLSLYQGSPDFNSLFYWSERWKERYKEWSEEFFLECKDLERKRRFFCRNAVAEYLTLLARRLPDTLPCYVSFDCSRIQRPIDQLEMLYPECWEGVNLHVIDSLLPLNTLGVDQVSASTAIYLPPMENYPPEDNLALKRLINDLILSKIPFRLIADERLTTQWEGLDRLFFDETRVSVQGRRKIQGFLAAGGAVIEMHH
jgi:hypothetical protein